MSGPMALEPGGPERDTLALRLAGERVPAPRGSDRHTLALVRPGHDVRGGAGGPPAPQPAPRGRPPRPPNQRGPPRGSQRRTA
ncbi:hypothetical protein ACFW4T_30355, partial [Streptomyces mutabilis]